MNKQEKPGILHRILLSPMNLPIHRPKGLALDDWTMFLRKLLLYLPEI